MGDNCTLEDWAKITRRAVADAQNGDAQARAWLSKHLIGEDPLMLVALVERLETEVDRVQTQFPDCYTLPAANGAPCGEAPPPGSAKPETPCAPADPLGDGLALPPVLFPDP
jgi:hypothetical protein